MRDEDVHTTALWNCTFEDFNAWIRREGGINAFMSSFVQKQHQPIGFYFDPNEGPDLSNWLLPIIPFDLSNSPTLNVITPLYDDNFVGASWFENKCDLYIAVVLWHMEKHTKFKVARSSNSRVEYQWHLDTCPFTLRASSRDGGWHIHRLNLQHNFNLDFSRLGLRSVRSLVVAAYFEKKMHYQSSIINSKDVMIELQQDFSIRIRYNVTLRARNNAISIIYGGQANSFHMLPKYLHMLRRENPRSMIDLEVGPNGCFKHMFVALGVCGVAFTTSLRQVIVVDAAHLKGRNKGVMFVAVTKDINEQLFPLAIGVGPIENDQSLKWFLSRVCVAFECNPNLVIISDQHASITNAIQDVFQEPRMASVSIIS